MVPRTVFSALLSSVLLISCSNASSDLSVISKTLKKDVSASTSGAPDLGMSMPSSGSVYWVEGKLKNAGAKEVRDVTVAFRLTDGNGTIVLSAVIPSIAAGATVEFRTPHHGSRLTMRLLEEDPDITVGR